MMERREITIHERRVVYRTAGSGPVVLLIHGMAGSATTWKHVMPALSDRYTVVAPDLLGHGRSDKGADDYSLGAFASMLRDLLVALGHERTTVVGQSLGGGVAMQLAYQYPERCERLALVGSGGLGREVNPVLRLLTYPGADSLLRIASAMPIRSAVLGLGKIFGRAGMEPAPATDELWRSYESLADADTRKAFLRTLRAVIDPKGQAISAENRLHLAAAMPTLIVWGDSDPIIPSATPFRPTRASRAVAWRSSRASATTRTVKRPRNSSPPSAISSNRRFRHRSRSRPNIWPSPGRAEPFRHPSGRSPAASIQEFRLSLSITGVPLHTRSLTTVASLREDGRWSIRGDVIDLRKSGFVPMTHDIQPAGIIHHMTIEMVFDPDSLRIDELETSQPHVAVEASERTRGECCRDPAVRLQALRGEVIDDAFTKQLSATFGGALGCSHLLTLFFAMAAAIPRAVAREAQVRREHVESRAAGERLFWRSIFIDGYEIEGEAIELSVQLADVHSHPHHAVESPLDRLDRQDEVRLTARVAPPDFAVTQLRAATRSRRMPNLGDAVWEECSEGLVSLLGHPVVPGLSRRVRALFQAEGSDELVRDALLQLAPGHIQVLAAITERWFVRKSPPEAAGETAGEDPTAESRPPVGGIGGMVDSCYMWRSDGPLIAERERVMRSRLESEPESRD